MALNCSHHHQHHRVAFPPRSSEENLVSRPMTMPGGGCFGDWEKVDVCFDSGRDRCESQDVDILDLLPSDPFGMDISTTVTAIKGWLEDYFIWNDALRWQRTVFPPANCFRCDSNPNLVGKFGYGYEPVEEKMMEEEDPSGGGCNAFGLDPRKEELSFLGDEMVWSNDLSNAADEMSIGDCCDADGDEVDYGFHSCLDIALGYLSLKDLLSIEMVCTSLHSAIRDDPSVWRSVHIDKPLNEKINDDVLVRLTDRAQGNLQHLTLVECQGITDAGLKHVLGNNPKLTKLSVPGCSKVNVNSIVTSLKQLKAEGKLSLKQLRIGAIYCVTQEHYDVLKCVLDVDPIVQQKPREPRYYNRENPYTSSDDDRALDIETCPKCRSHTLVYDCPAESCQKVKHSAQACRACRVCIRRCADCGRCINDIPYTETFSLDLLCASCGSIS